MFMKRIKNQLLAASVLLTIFAGFVMPQSIGAQATTVPSLDKIRVALFLNHPNSTLTAKATFSTSVPINVGYRNGNAVRNWFQTSEKVGVQLNQYYVLIGAYNRWQDANTTANKIKITSDEIRDKQIIERELNNVTRYYLYVGPFSSPPEASTLSAYSSETGVALNALKVVGQRYWDTTGSFVSSITADTQLDTLQAAGIEAYKVYVETPNGPATRVWIGPGLNQLDFDQIKANALAAIPTLKLSEAVTTPSSKETPLSFLIEKRQVVPDSKGLTSTYINKYLLNPYNENIYLTASKNISIAEHYNRSYRGDIEVTSRSNYLAVINVVDFEKYLYSVVTSEMGGFSLEALKAQAVAARTFALTRGNAYVIANISDTTADQAYNGAGTENENCRIAVDSTSGIVMMYYDTYGKLKLASPYYSSNMGGQTAVGSEVWGNNVVYTKSVASPDQIAESNVIWYRVIMSKLPSSQAKMVGTVGYIHSDYLQDTGRKTGSGQSVYTSTTAVKIRTAPSTSRGDEIYVLDSKGNKILDSKGNPVPLRLNPGDEAVKLEQVRQWNSYSWITRDYSGIEMKTIINKKLTDWNKPTYSTSIKSLVVSKRGPSNRLMEVKANGQVLPVSNPDRFRSILGGIWSTKDVEIENSASYTVLGADGKKINSPDNLRTLYAISASSPSTPKAINQAFIALNKNNRSMYRTIQPFFRIKGKGNGHGLGMSQWGAEGLARQGKKYDYILNYYFKDITLQKGTN